MFMQLYIWGAGDKGWRIFQHLKEEDVLGFVDNNPDKIGKKYHGKKVISMKEYKKKYSDKYIIVSHTLVDDIDLKYYFILADCPGELQEPKAGDLLKNYVLEYLKNKKDYVLYGFSLYAILVDRWIWEHFGYHPQLLLDNEAEKKLEHIKLSFPKLNIISLNDMSKKQYEIISLIRKCDYENCTNLFDCSSKISSYFNEKITAYKDIHKNSSCFIVATGPSLTVGDLEKLYNSGYISFSVNKIYNMYELTGWRPDYYVCCDYRAIEEYSDIIGKIAKDTSFIADSSEVFWREDHYENILKFHYHYEYYENTSPKFSENPAQCMYSGMTVTYVCIQLAAYMGFKNIYLLGTDCNYVANGKNNYFYKTDKPDTFNHQVDKTILAYKAAKKYADEHGIKIYNATRGGMLEVFERVDFDRLFDK